MKIKFCCCIITVNKKGNTLFEGCEHVLDTVTFPNPDIDPLALEACRARVEALKRVGVPARAAVIEMD